MGEVRTAIPSTVSSAARPPCSGLVCAPTCPRPAGWRQAGDDVSRLGRAQPTAACERARPWSHYYLTRRKQAPATCKKHSLPDYSRPSVCLSLPATTLSPAAAPPPPTPPPTTPARHISFRPRILLALNNNRLAFPNQSHARDNNLRTDSWSRT
jgi:hypothetical protein